MIASACLCIKLSQVRSHLQTAASWLCVWYKISFPDRVTMRMQTSQRALLVTFVTGNKNPRLLMGIPRIPQLPLFLVDHHLTRRWLWLFPPTSTVYHSQFEVRQQLDFTMQGDVVLKSEFDVPNTFTPNINIIQSCSPKCKGCSNIRWLPCIKKSWAFCRDKGQCGQRRSQFPHSEDTWSGCAVGPRRTFYYVSEHETQFSFNIHGAFR